MSNPEIGIIGSGVAGLACARRLTEAGMHARILDKGRVLGGRLATRRSRDGFAFDHGAQYLTCREPGFEAALGDMVKAGAAGDWPEEAERRRIVGIPGMNAIAQHLSAGLDITQGVEIKTIHEDASGWVLASDDGERRVRQLVITAPAPQAAALLGPEHALYSAITSARLAPCLTLMAAFAPSAPIPYQSHRDPDDPLSWIALDSSKPGRDAAHSAWVAQASPSWSAEHLERDKPEIAELMLPMLCDRLGADPSTLLYASAHRWRYANATEPLGAPFLSNAAGSLFVGGDWCLGARVEAAWTSGRAIANAILDAA